MQGPEECQQLAAGLARQGVIRQQFFEAQLGQDSKTDFLAMEMASAGRQLGQAVVDGMGRHGAAAGATKTSHQAGGQGTTLGHPHPGCRVGIGQGGFAIEQQLIPQRSSHLQGLLHQPIVIGATTN
jgi:hypothetical protein